MGDRPGGIWLMHDSTREPYWTSASVRGIGVAVIISMWTGCATLRCSFSRWRTPNLQKGVQRRQLGSGTHQATLLRSSILNTLAGFDIAFLSGFVSLRSSLVLLVNDDQAEGRPFLVGERACANHQVHSTRLDARGQLLALLPSEAKW